MRYFSQSVELTQLEGAQSLKEIHERKNCSGRYIQSFNNSKLTDSVYSKTISMLTQSNSNLKWLESQCKPYAFDISVSTLHALSDVLENQIKFPFCCVYAKTISPYNKSFRLRMSQLTMPYTTISVQCPYRIIIMAWFFRDTVWFIFGCLYFNWWAISRNFHEYCNQFSYLRWDKSRFSFENGKFPTMKSKLIWNVVFSFSLKILSKWLVPQV